MYKIVVDICPFGVDNKVYKEQKQASCSYSFFVNCVFKGFCYYGIALVIVSVRQSVGREMRNELQGIRLITDTVISGRNFHFPLYGSYRHAR
jgi:hypothetical protein